MKRLLQKSNQDKLLYLSKAAGSKGAVVVLGMLCGLLIFLAIYGPGPLDVTNDNWILAGYDEPDLPQHYAGWLAFRNSDWSFPLGLAGQMAYPEGTLITYTDSIPWAAVCFKLLSGILPETFQYLGIYTLLCYMLQAAAAGLLVRRKTKHPGIILPAMVLFGFAPILMERAFRHTALASQWLILFAIYYYLEYRTRIRSGSGFRLKKAYLLLLFLAIGIHPYFMPMIMVFVFLTALELFLNKAKSLFVAGFLLLHLAVPLLFGYLLGALGSSVGLSRGGFGHFSMNLNAVLNPTSKGGYNWSEFLRVRPQILGNYDGFNYLGIGILLLLAVIIIGEIRAPGGILKRNKAYFAAMVFLTCFALSHVITLDHLTLFTLPLPEWLVELCGIFRASSRMFYPVFYSIYVVLIYLLLDQTSTGQPKAAAAVLTLIMLLQLLDLRSVIVQKHHNMNASLSYESILMDQELRSAVTGCELFVLREVGDPMVMREFAIFAAKTQMATSYSVANSGDYTLAEQHSDELTAALNQGRHNGKTVFCTPVDEIADVWIEQNPDLRVYEYLYFDFLIPDTAQR